LRWKLGALPLGPAALLPRTRLATAYGTAGTDTVFTETAYGNEYGTLESRHDAANCAAVVLATLAHKRDKLLA